MGSASPGPSPVLWLLATEGCWGPWAGLQAEVSVSCELIWTGNSRAGCLVEELGGHPRGWGAAARAHVCAWGWGCVCATTAVLPSVRGGASTYLCAWA